MKKSITSLEVRLVLVRCRMKRLVWEMKVIREERKQSVEVRLSVDQQHKANPISPLFHLNEKSGRGAMPQL